MLASQELTEEGNAVEETLNGLLDAEAQEKATAVVEKLKAMKLKKAGALLVGWHFACAEM